MTSEQKLQEIVKSRKELMEVKEALKASTKQYDLIRYNYGKQYVDDRLKLENKIESKSEIVEYLTLKLSLLSDSNINLGDIAWEKLDNLSSLQKLKANS